jgi:hypothetical protein
VAMQEQPAWRQAMLTLSLVIVVLGTAGVLVPAPRTGKAKRGHGPASTDIGTNAAPGATTAPATAASRFTPQTRLGFFDGDQWEPAIADDDYGSVYVLYPHCGGVPGCPACASPTAILQVSRDRGQSWEPPSPIASSGTEQVDTQVDPVDGRTVFASWLENGKSDTVVARSTDLGHTWSKVVADHTNAGTDKPILAVRGR